MSTTIDDLIREVRALAEQSPDRIYTPPDGAYRCSYLASKDDPDRGCIMGQAFERLGVPRTSLQLIEERGIDEVLEPLDVVIPQRHTAEAIMWLRTVQRKQDVGQRWGSAVATADNYHPTVKQ